MRMIPLLVALPLLLFPLAKSGAAGLKDYGKLPAGMEEVQDKAKEGACDCCQKCKAAKKPVLSKEQEGAGALESSGCEDCCKQCGQVLKPTPEDTPPEIIDKKSPPDIIEKEKP
jgi:hypothetical protein